MHAPEFTPNLRALTAKMGGRKKKIPKSNSFFMDLMLPSSIDRPLFPLRRYNISFPYTKSVPSPLLDGHQSLFVHPTCLHSNDLLAIVQKDSHPPLPWRPLLASNSSPMTSPIMNNAHMLKLEGADCWNDGKNRGNMTSSMSFIHDHPKPSDVQSRCPYIISSHEDIIG